VTTRPFRSYIGQHARCCHVCNAGASIYARCGFSAGQVMLTASIAAIAATILGLYVSFDQDLPTNQTICAIACAVLLIGAAVAEMAGKEPPSITT